VNRSSQDPGPTLNLRLRLWICACFSATCDPPHPCGPARETVPCGGCSPNAASTASRVDGTHGVKVNSVVGRRELLLRALRPPSPHQKGAFRPVRLRELVHPRAGTDVEPSSACPGAPDGLAHVTHLLQSSPVLTAQPGTAAPARGVAQPERSPRSRALRTTWRHSPTADRQQPQREGHESEWRQHRPIQMSHLRTPCGCPVRDARWSRRSRRAARSAVSGREHATAVDGAL
jgi:hypothetical protein